MELEFKNIDEFFEFIEKLGYVKKEDCNIEVSDDKLDLSKITINKTCPYGFANCPYNKDITPYYPYPNITTPYCHTDVGASQNTEWETTSSTSGDETITINMKDISQKK